jgi:molecular chaperone HtpG
VLTVILLKNLLKKTKFKFQKLSDDETEKLTVLETGSKPTYNVQLEVDSNASPFIITQPEFMRE